ncbi:hypothetical protein F4776DRAFT_646795 [Hypoxylon sp. NC0597]|nr:hypothetical protein F4776DRAFT_646795 [Hypoxylon sp. NC0597]
MKIWTSAVSIITLLPLAVAECDNFAFTGEGLANEGFTTTYDASLRTSAWLNCTPEIVIQDGLFRNSCEIHNPSSVGLVVHPTINLTNLDTEAQRDIFSLVEENASASAVAGVNFNTTIVINFTSQGTFYTAVGQAGFSAFTPYMRCWEGVLSDCDDDDNLEGRAAQVCGLAWLHVDERSKPAGEQMYKGIEGFVQTDLSSGPTDPLPSYESVANQATDEERDGHNAAAMSRVDSMALLFALLCSVYAIIL